VRVAAGADDLRAAAALRHLCFVDVGGAQAGAEADRFDDLCRHILIDDAQGNLAGCFRFMHLTSGAQVALSYSASAYDLSVLSTYPHPMLELGRFCVAPDLAHDGDVLRLAWGALARLVDDGGVGMLFGCASFQGTDAAVYADALALLAQHHVGPENMRPAVKAPDTIAFDASRQPDPHRATAQLPPLLRTYLGMGGWVGDHAVVDAAMNTLHVFTALEIAAIPQSRARALRAIADTVTL